MDCWFYICRGQRISLRPVTVWRACNTPCCRSVNQTGPGNWSCTWRKTRIYLRDDSCNGDWHIYYWLVPCQKRKISAGWINECSDKRSKIIPEKILFGICIVWTYISYFSQSRYYFGK